MTFSAAHPSSTVVDQTLQQGEVSRPAARTASIWLFESRWRGAPTKGMRLYLLISLMGLLGFIGLLALSAAFPNRAFPLRLAALAWFIVFGALRVSTFTRS